MVNIDDSVYQTKHNGTSISPLYLKMENKTNRSNEVFGTKNVPSFCFRIVLFFVTVVRVEFRFVRLLRALRAIYNILSGGEVEWKARY